MHHPIMNIHLDPIIHVSLSEVTGEQDINLHHMEIRRAYFMLRKKTGSARDWVDIFPCYFPFMIMRDNIISTLVALDSVTKANRMLRKDREDTSLHTTSG